MLIYLTELFILWPYTASWVTHNGVDTQCRPQKDHNNPENVHKKDLVLLIF